MTPSNVPPAGPRRRHMRNLVLIGTRWHRRRDGHIMRVTQVHRADRLAQVLDEITQSVALVSFTDLRTRHSLLIDVDHVPLPPDLHRELEPTGRVLKGAGR